MGFSLCCTGGTQVANALWFTHGIWYKRIVNWI